MTTSVSGTGAKATLWSSAAPGHVAHAKNGEHAPLS